VTVGSLAACPRSRIWWTQRVVKLIRYILPVPFGSLWPKQDLCVETEMITSEQVRLSAAATCGRPCLVPFLQQNEYKLGYRSSSSLTSCTINLTLSAGSGGQPLPLICRKRRMPPRAAVRLE
jgi:hypothetical protein